MRACDHRQLDKQIAELTARAEKAEADSAWFLRQRNDEKERSLRLGARTEAAFKAVAEARRLTEKAEAELRRITPYANHTQFCAISTYDGPHKEVACDCGFVEAVAP
jgi:multidrug resistance efflux pump